MPSTLRRLLLVGALGSTVLVTTATGLPGPLGKSISWVRGLPEQPGIILLSDEEDLELRAKLLAAGALAVIPSTLSTAGLRETLAPETVPEGVAAGDVLLELGDPRWMDRGR